MPDVIDRINDLLLATASARCRHVGAPIYFAESENMKFKTETWELVELVMAGCPEQALKSFRKSVIGRGKPLTAREADAAIGGARSALAGFERESILLWTHRQNWYLDHQMPVIYANRYASRDPAVHIALYAAQKAGSEMIFLQFDDEGVSRVPVPLRRSALDEEVVAG